MTDLLFLLFMIYFTTRNSILSENITILSNMPQYHYYILFYFFLFIVYYSYSFFKYTKNKFVLLAALLMYTGLLFPYKVHTVNGTLHVMLIQLSVLIILIVLIHYIYHLSYTNYNQSLQLLHLISSAFLFILIIYFFCGCINGLIECLLLIFLILIKQNIKNHSIRSD